MHKCIC